MQEVLVSVVGVEGIYLEQDKSIVALMDVAPCLICKNFHSKKKNSSIGLTDLYMNKVLDETDNCVEMILNKIQRAICSVGGRGRRVCGDQEGSKATGNNSHGNGLFEVIRIDLVIDITWDDDGAEEIGDEVD